MRGSKMTVSYKDTNWSILLELWPFIREFRVRIGLALLCLVGAKIASVGLPFILKYLVDALDKSPGNEVLLVLPLGLLLGYGMLRFANVLFGELRDTLFGRATEKAMRQIGLKVFRHMHELDIAFHLNRQTGGISRDIERGTNGLSFIMRFLVFNIVPTLLEIFMVAGILWWNYSFSFAGLVIVSVIAYIAFSVFTTEWRTSFLREVNQAESSSSTRAIDSLLNFETVKLFTNESYEADRYDQSLEIWESARRKNRLSLFVLNSGQALIISAAMTVALILAAQYVINAKMTLGDFVLINSFMMQIFMPLNFLGFVYREMKGSLASIENMMALLKIAPAIKEIPGAKPLEVKGGHIRFEHVSFGYGPDRKIIDNVSFEVQPGEKVAIVGASGSGKSTLFKLLFRFYEADSGTISIDDQPINSVTIHSLRANIGVIPQDTVLFNDTLEENIRYGDVTARSDAVKSALEQAHLTPLINALPNGMETRVGERGLKLSGGEKQRVSIARALLKNPPILIFDEATSSLDSHAEQMILATMASIAKKQTSLVIAHRLSTIQDADKILVLDHGRLMEAGTHQTLLAKKGYYHKLWHLQQSQHKEDNV